MGREGLFGDGSGCKKGNRVYYRMGAPAEPADGSSVPDGLSVDLSVLFGNLGGAVLAVGNFFLLAWTVSRAVDKGKPEEAAQRVKATATLRLLGVGALCALLIGVFKTNVFATLIPLLFPRAAIAFRPFIDRKRGKEPAGTEGSDLID